MHQELRELIRNGVAEWSTANKVDLSFSAGNQLADSIYAMVENVISVQMKMHEKELEEQKKFFDGKASIQTELKYSGDAKDIIPVLKNVVELYIHQNKNHEFIAKDILYHMERRLSSS